jgi:glycosyltransferase involved in cell wall biosynthesis
MVFRRYWQTLRLPRLAKAAGCDVLFAPGGLANGRFSPYVTMCRNMLPFEPGERRRYGFGWLRLKFMLLRLQQGRSFQHAAGLIYLTEYARRRIAQALPEIRGIQATIPHGVSPRFYAPPRPARPISDYTDARPFRMIYVSIIDVYKHQWHAAEAVAKLRASGYPVVLDLVGPSYGPAMERLRGVMNRVDPRGDFIRYLGSADYSSLPALYLGADLKVFASSCENMPNILMEAMASGLPVACSERGPMPEIVGPKGIYFDPENPDSIATSLRRLVDSPELRHESAWSGYEWALRHSWSRCASETFRFIAAVAENADPSRTP